MPDVFHTFFGIAGLCLVGWFEEEARKNDYLGFTGIDPVYALPIALVEKLGLKAMQG
jgi:geranylgeranyl transferase type-2 subunit beta